MTAQPPAPKPRIMREPLKSSLRARIAYLEAENAQLRARLESRIRLLTKAGDLLHSVPAGFRPLDEPPTRWPRLRATCHAWWRRWIGALT